MTRELAHKWSTLVFQVSSPAATSSREGALTRQACNGRLPRKSLAGCKPLHCTALHCTVPHRSAAALKLCSHCWPLVSLFDLQSSLIEPSQPRSSHLPAATLSSMGTFWAMRPCEPATLIELYLARIAVCHCNFTQIGSHNPAALGRWSRCASPGTHLALTSRLSRTLVPYTALRLPLTAAQRA